MDFFNHCSQEDLDKDLLAIALLEVIKLETREEMELYWAIEFSDGGKPDFFQNPGSGSNPGFNLKNPGFPVPK